MSKTDVLCLVVSVAIGVTMMICDHNDVFRSVSSAGETLRSLCSSIAIEARMERMKANPSPEYDRYPNSEPESQTSERKN